MFKSMVRSKKCKHKKECYKKSSEMIWKMPERISKKSKKKKKKNKKKNKKNKDDKKKILC